MIVLDFETRSACDLIKLGATRYAYDASTQVLCLSWLFSDVPIPEVDDVALWHRNHPWIEKSDRPDELLARIADGELVEAHNARFEFLIWNHVLMREFPEFDVPIRLEQLRCSAAKASCLSLPRALGEAVAALGLPRRKDIDGNRLIQKLSKPMKRRKGEAPDTVRFCEEEIEHRRNWRYNQQDVRAESGLSEFCPEMSERELDYWMMDFRMNERGIKLDVEAARKSVQICEQEVERLNAEMHQLTDGAVPGGSKRQRFKAWADKQLSVLNAGSLPDTKADTLSFALYGAPTKAGDEAKAAAKPIMDAKWAAWGDTGKALRRAMEICLEVNRSSVAKYRQMMGSVCPDGRLHDIMLYNGADRPVTGDAEVLTRNGWMKIEDWPGGEIAQWSHVKGTAGQITFAHADRVVTNYDGEMVRMRGPSSELVCTVDHKIPLISCRENLTDYAAGKVRRMNWALPLAGVLSAQQFKPEDVTRAVVMTQADGALIYDDTRLDCVRFGFTKTRKIERARALLTRLGIPFSEHQEQSGNHAVRFRIAARNAPPWMCSAKTFGPWLMDHNPLVFIDELRHWDGCTDKRNAFPGTSYSTCSKANAEWVQTMAALAGTRAHIEVRGIRDPNWNRSYRVHVHSSGARSWLKKNWTFAREPSPGKVYCARTQTGYFLVRYNGTIQVTGNTGRWSGKGVQPHNFVRGYQKEMADIWDCLIGTPTFAALDSEMIELVTGDLMLPAMAKACRGALTASDGMELYAADFNAIEARKLAWMSGCATQLTLFQTGGDPYCDMASAIYGRLITKKDKTERQMGKKAVLGLGYRMGWEKFQASVWADEGIWLEDEFCQEVVRIYRKVKCPEVHTFWNATEKAALAAVTQGGEYFAGGDELGAGAISYFLSDDRHFLHCRLPSGRLLAYLFPEVHSKVSYRFTAINERGKPTTVMFPAKIGVPMSRVRYHAEQMAAKAKKSLTPDPPESFMTEHLSFMGRDTYTKQWKRCGTHGGSLVENADQASSRDLLAESMWRVDQHPDFGLLLSIHDEVVAEAPIGTATINEFEAMMAEVPAWAPGMPIAAEGWIGTRLRK